MKTIFDAADKGKEPLRKFLAQHSHPRDRLLFMELSARLEQQATTLDAHPTQPVAEASAMVPASISSPATPAPESPPPAPALDKEDFRVLIPSFVTSDLKNALQIGFLIFLPFLIVDMVVANVLLSMGMSMLSPSVISLPFKLLLLSSSTAGS